MIAKILLATLVTGAMVTNVMASDKGVSILTTYEKIDGASKLTRTIIYPDEQLKDCSGTGCDYPWGSENIKIAGSHAISTFDVDMKFVDCQIDKSTKTVSCEQRTTPLTDDEWNVELQKASVAN